MSATDSSRKRTLVLELLPFQNVLQSDLATKEALSKTPRSSSHLSGSWTRQPKNDAETVPATISPE
jgi:hypothetical protein